MELRRCSNGKSRDHSHYQSQDCIPKNGIQPVPPCPSVPRKGRRVSLNKANFFFNFSTGFGTDPLLTWKHWVEYTVSTPQQIRRVLCLPLTDRIH